jgi:hypothetical protein
MLERTLPGPADNGDSCLDHGVGVDFSHMGKGDAPTLPEGKMGYALTSLWPHQSDFKKTIVKIVFLFHLGNAMLIIYVTQTTSSLIVEFDAC